MTWRDYVPSIDLRKWLRSGGRTGARLASITAFVVLLGLTVFAAFTAGSVVIAALATFVLFFMLRAALPAERIDTFVSDLLSGGRRPVVRVAPRPVGRTPPTALPMTHSPHVTTV